MINQVDGLTGFAIARAKYLADRVGKIHTGQHLERARILHRRPAFLIAMMQMNDARNDFGIVPLRGDQRANLRVGIAKYLTLGSNR
jgi:hypothetical protein